MERPLLKLFNCIRHFLPFETLRGTKFSKRKSVFYVAEK